MKAFVALSVGSLLVVGVSSGEEEKKIDLEARKATIPIVESHIADRQERMTEIANDIMMLDRRLESKVDKVVARLASIKDSSESGYRVSQIKMQAMEGLKKTAEEYQSRRSGLITEIREGRSAIPKEVLENDAKIFDQHTEKRVEQILELSKSFTQHADVKKYEKVDGGGYDTRWGWHEETRISDEYRQNRRDGSMDKKQQDEIVEALKKSITRHEQLVATYKQNLAEGKLSKIDAELMRAEMNRHIQLLDERQGQLAELNRVAQPATDPLQRDAAMHLQDSLRDAAADMREDFDTIFRKYAQLNAEREKLYSLKENLAARKKWIADYEAGQKN